MNRQFRQIMTAGIVVFIGLATVLVAGAEESASRANQSEPGARVIEPPQQRLERLQAYREQMRPHVEAIEQLSESLQSGELDPAAFREAIEPHRQAIARIQAEMFLQLSAPDEEDASEETAEESDEPFARGQFQELEESEKLDQPDFEQLEVSRHLGSDADAAGAHVDAMEIRAVELSGQRAPDGQGTISGFGHRSPILNNRGEVVFVAEIHAPRADMDHHAILRSDPGGEVRQLLRTGQALPGAAGGFGWLYSDGELFLNDAGQLAVYVATDARDEPVRAIYRIDGDGAVSLIYRPGHGGDGVPNHPIMNNRGQVAFQVDRDDDDPDDRTPGAIYLAGGPGGLSRLAGQGDRVDGTHSLGPGMSLGSAVTEEGAISLFASLNPDDTREAPGQGFYLAAGGELRQLARRGESTGAPDEVWDQLHHIRHTQVNARGQAIFYGRAARRPIALGARPRAGWFLHDGEGVSELVVQGQGAPDGNGRFERIGTTPALNDSGQVAFGASLTGTRQRGRDDQGIFLAVAGGQIRQLVRSGQAAPDGDGEFAGSFSLPAINAQGQAAFAARLTGEANRGIFVAYPDGTIRTIVRVGQTLPEGRVTDVSFAGNAPGRNGFNDAGQVVFHARLEQDGDHREGIFLATSRGR